MPGYRNRVITLRFDDLAEPGDDIHIVIRNPKLIPAAELRSLAGKGGGADAQRLADARQQLAAAGDAGDLVTEEDADRGFEFAARLIVGWRVYDAASTEENQPLLPSPATAELVGKLPLEILERLMNEVGGANPPQPPADGTSRTS